MPIWFHKTLSNLRGKNSESTPESVIKDQLLEPRPLPMGRTEFEVWADRIISGALVSAERHSQIYTLANLILHLGPTESHKPDAFFIHSLRKLAANEVADSVRRELYAAKQKREAEEKEEQRQSALKREQYENDLLEEAGIQSSPEAVVPAH